MKPIKSKRIFTILCYLLIVVTLLGFSPSIQAQYLPSEGAVYQIYVDRGITTPKGFLSVEGDDVDLWHKDDESGRQKWLFEKVGRNNLGETLYHIKVFYTPGNTRMLSTNRDGGVNTWNNDDESGRQRWILKPLRNGKFNIVVAGGTCCDRVFLSCRKEDGQVDLYPADDNSGRQQWNIVPEDVSIVSIDFNLNAANKVSAPDFVSQITLPNQTNKEVNMSAVFQRKATNTSSFEHQHGFTFSVSAEGGIQVPLLSEGKLSVSASTTNTWTYGKTESQEDTRGYTFSVPVGPYKTVKAVLTVKMYKVDIPYVAYGKSKSTGQRVESRGIWRGVLADELIFQPTLIDP